MLDETLDDFTLVDKLRADFQVGLACHDFHGPMLADFSPEKVGALARVFGAQFWLFSIAIVPSNANFLFLNIGA